MNEDTSSSTIAISLVLLTLRPVLALRETYLHTFYDSRTDDSSI